MYLDVSDIVCFLTFSVKHKENDSNRIYTSLGGPAEKLYSSTISQIEQNW